jgi:hypothetical protein
MANKRNYFNAEVDSAIKEYNSSTSHVTKNHVYEKYIHKAVHKIAENLIHRYKFYHLPCETIKDSIHEIECFVLERLCKIDTDKGKPYSYLTKMIYNYLLFHCKDVYKQKVNKGILTEVDDSDISKKRYVINDYIKEEVRTDYYTPNFIAYMRTNLNEYFVGRINLITASSILNIIEDRHTLEIFDKKSIYIYIRNIVSISQPNFVKILKTIKELYFKYQDIYNEQFDKIIEDSEFLEDEEEFSEFDENETEFDEFAPNLSDDEIDSMFGEIEED